MLSYSCFTSSIFCLYCASLCWRRCFFTGIFLIRFLLRSPLPSDSQIISLLYGIFMDLYMLGFFFFLKLSWLMLRSQLSMHQVALFLSVVLGIPLALSISSYSWGFALPVLGDYIFSANLAAGALYFLQNVVTTIMDSSSMHYCSNVLSRSSFLPLWTNAISAVRKSAPSRLLPILWSGLTDMWRLSSIYTEHWKDFSTMFICFLWVLAMLCTCTISPFSM